MRTRVCVIALVGFLLMGLGVAPAWGLDEAHRKRAEEAIAQGVARLRQTQAEDGSWMPKPGPAVTALALRALLAQPDISPRDPAAAKALRYVLSRAKEDGGIHDGTLENYNTAICLSALAAVKDDADAARAARKAQDYLRKLQWSDQQDPQGTSVGEAHPFYGGAGYGREGRPDLSNTQVMLEGLYDSGLDCNDPAFTRALTFITRCQGTPANKLFGSKIKPDGGFIYATSQGKDKIGVLESKAGEETVDVPGQGPTSVLRTYGSMTYAGFKSYLYANLDREDRRVKDALGWIKRNYALDRNPGLPEASKLQGHYYYLLTFSRALRAWGESTLTTEDGKTHDWANDLIDELAGSQAKDGSWTNTADRWMEGDPNLVTCDAVLALQEAIR